MQKSIFVPGFEEAETGTKLLFCIFVPANRCLAEHILIYFAAFERKMTHVLRSRGTSIEVRRAVPESDYFDFIVPVQHLFGMD